MSDNAVTYNPPGPCKATFVLYHECGHVSKSTSHSSICRQSNTSTPSEDPLEVDIFINEAPSCQGAEVRMVSIWPGIACLVCSGIDNNAARASCAKGELRQYTWEEIAEREMIWLAAIREGKGKLILEVKPTRTVPPPPYSSPPPRYTSPST